MNHWLKFNVVGLLGFALQSAVLFALTRATYSIGYLAATALAVELAVLNNFVWHQRWTWSDRPSRNKRQTLRRLAKFNFTAGLVSIIGNLIFMSILVGQFRLPISGANAITVGICSLVSFFLADRIAFDLDDATPWSAATWRRILPRRLDATGSRSRLAATEQSAARSAHSKE